MAPVPFIGETKAGTVSTSGGNSAKVFSPVFPVDCRVRDVFLPSHLTKASLATQHVTARHDGDLILLARTDWDTSGCSV